MSRRSPWTYTRSRRSTRLPLRRRPHCRHLTRPPTTPQGRGSCYCRWSIGMSIWLAAEYMLPREAGAGSAAPCWLTVVAAPEDEAEARASAVRPQSLSSKIVRPWLVSGCTSVTEALLTGRLRLTTVTRATRDTRGDGRSRCPGCRISQRSMVSGENESRSPPTWIYRAGKPSTTWPKQGEATQSPESLDLTTT